MYFYGRCCVDSYALSHRIFSDLHGTLTHSSHIYLLGNVMLWDSKLHHLWIGIHGTNCLAHGLIDVVERDSLPNCVWFPLWCSWIGNIKDIGSVVHGWSPFSFVHSSSLIALCTLQHVPVHVLLSYCVLNQRLSKVSMASLPTLLLTSNWEHLWVHSSFAWFICLCWCVHCTTLCNVDLCCKYSWMNDNDKCVATPKWHKPPIQRWWENKH